MNRRLVRLALLAGLSVVSSLCLADANPPAAKDKVDVGQLLALYMPWNGYFADTLDPLDVNSVDLIIPGDDWTSSAEVDALLRDK